MILNISDAEMYAFDKVPSLKLEDGVYKDVMYNILAGEYRLVPSNNMTYIEVTKDSTEILDSIITNNNLDAEKYITVEDGRYLKIHDALIKAGN
ncbi:hypothetical protein U732_1033 [Clostridium argentinense CDC 2741]|uniref:Uncharacterized protein n=1 Tax=Clostridium argentinense CDC 2741 TaxID=1418104 RepID=A0A0C1R9G4_9CLOT|nr:hypothetical protein [Clostridium argentinense]ARC85720.1 hypothetical protein RSJ17_14990 [Clostridium argentinense]KIE47076.1 hypothetical protein U732_1033 [Clostridium argentinense CDC 2741]NFF40754.1 hypothetical protein [Clostridium argentinense]NFP50686.1 hypothetical protein [Clostridium argentinense]NFP74692.1 hypothetical protein [Clostridium argentinense]